MNKDELKKYSVIVGDGSGCLFQPMTGDYTYILTANHLFFKTIENDQGQEVEERLPDGTIIDIKRYKITQNGWEEDTISFVIKNGETYFPHKSADIAILKISPLSEEYNGISIEYKFDQSDRYELCGYPSSLNTKREYTTHIIENFICSNDYGYSARLFGTLSENDIKGMSGGGILRFVDENISIIGVQSKMGKRVYPAGEIGFVQIKYFNEIIEYEENYDKLVPLLPTYLTTFKFFKNDIFKLQESITTRKKSTRLSEVLMAKSNKIMNSSLTPYEIKTILIEKIEVINNDGFNDYTKIKFWGKWLELLTILSIAELYIEKNETLVTFSKNNFYKILSMTRLFYADTDKCFWLENIDKLHKMNYGGLNKGCTVVVASNVKAEGEMHVLDTKLIVEDIARVRNKFDEDIVMGNIDVASDFPLEKYKFANISAFMEGVVNRLEDGFETKSIVECIAELKKIYGEILSNGEND